MFLPSLRPLVSVNYMHDWRSEEPATLRCGLVCKMGMAEGFVDLQAWTSNDRLIRRPPAVGEYPSESQSSRCVHVARQGRPWHRRGDPCHSAQLSSRCKAVANGPSRLESVAGQKTHPVRGAVGPLHQRGATLAVSRKFGLTPPTWARRVVLQV